MSTIDGVRPQAPEASEPPDTPPTPGARRWSRRRWLLAAMVVVTVTLAALAGTAAAWGSQLRAADQLLPGTTIAGVDVSLETADGARAQVAAVLDASLDHEVTVVADAVTMTVSARQLGAETDVDQVVAEALRATQEASLVEFARLRFLGADERSASANVVLHDDAVAAAIAALAADADHAPRDATLRVVDGAFVTTAAATGFQLDQAAATEALRAALDDGATDPVEMAGTTLEPMVTDAMATEAMALADTSRTSALTPQIVLTHGESTWTVTPEELGGQVDEERLAADALAVVLGDADPDVLVVQATPAADAVAALLDEVAAAVHLPTSNASVSWSGGRVVRTGGSAGRALDRDALQATLDDVFADPGTATAPLDVPTITTAPSRDLDAVRDVLVVHQSRTLVELHRGDQVVRSWPVAVGTGGSPTPTGTFVVGAKRFEPTWVNPARDRWGADMPARIGPGPDNPLGVRALNWNRLGGGDTLIRFHGTPNEASIGTASSNGCVRMFNRDVIELYDLVPSGTMIISLA